ncbi:MAG TPA: GNAT family N-acetyltransferase [Flavisolibacter sp.]|jgi:putative acetyltransferase|nr:GNAT family N-acetyltransferase [Flavisolibacter sp.]
MSLPLEEIKLRAIEEKDNAAIANVIRSTLVEFGANHPGTVYYDAATDALFQLFEQTPRSVYFIAEKDGEVVGGGGIFPSEGLAWDTCELVKMYLLPQVRGIGLGRKIIDDCIAFASRSGYKNIYLETMPELRQALKTYAKFGFEYIDRPMGNTGHTGCSLWMLKRFV